MRFLTFFLFISTNIYSQCDFKDLFPFKIGYSKFDVMQVFSSNETVVELDIEDHMKDVIDLQNRWKKPAYLKDSVYVSVINWTYKNNPCFKNQKSHLQLKLVDDYLYKATISIKYENLEYNSMLEKYEEILGLIPEKYKYTSEFTTQTKDTNEKKGQGTTFYVDNELTQEKVNQIRVGYEIDYKLIFGMDGLKLERSNQISSYTIEINIVDLTETKLTTKGY